MRYILLPFVNALILHIFISDGQIFNKQFMWFRNNVVPRLPIHHKILGGCILCTGFWLGTIEILIARQDLFSIFLIAYNAVLTKIIYKNL